MRPEGSDQGTAGATAAVRGAGPPTRTLWLHAAPPSDPAAIRDLIDTVEQDRPEVAVIGTGEAMPPERRHTPSPGSARLSVRAFLGHHAPVATVFAGQLDAGLAEAVAKAGMPALWLDAVPPPPRRWPRRTSALPVAHFMRILTGPGAAQERLARNADAAQHIETVGFLESTHCPLPYSVQQRDRLAADLAGRPVWLAAEPAAAEIPALLEAHRSAAGQSHRLLLVLAIGPDTASPLPGHLRSEGWHVGRRSDGAEPVPEDQILIADDLDELGLWYRLAPITFLGGSLSGPAMARSPLEAAALGSAIVHGPVMTPHEMAIRRLAEAGATRIADDPDSLGRAVTRLLSADVAARMATAGWDVVTAGAPAMQRAAELIGALLDRGETP